jgi:hypothetical protein
MNELSDTELRLELTRVLIRRAQTRSESGNLRKKRVMSKSKREACMERQRDQRKIYGACYTVSVSVSLALFLFSLSLSL